MEDVKRKFNNLHKFVANNYALEKLEATLQEFNPFKVLKIDNYEIRHSNILSWLLNPKENHNFSDSFLKKFLSEVIINNENIDTKLTVFDVQEISYHDIEIKREWDNIDIVLISKSNKLVILIENKVHSSESRGQLQRYLKFIASQFNNYEIIPVFLTLEGIAPTDDRYGVISYIQILHMLRFITSIRKENLSHKVYDFANYYIRTLELMTMEDEEIKKLCKNIYRDHREALDLIWEYAEETEFENAANEFISSIKAREIVSNLRWAWFIPEELEKSVEMVGESSWCEGFPVACWFLPKEESLGLIIEVGPFIDESLRRDFLQHLKNNGIKVSDRAFKPGSKYTRIFTKYPKFEDWDDKESIVEKMEDLYSKTLKKEIDKLVSACDSFDWKV